MRILFLEWNSFCNEDIIQAFMALGHQVIKMSYDENQDIEVQYKSFSETLKKTFVDFVFSFNYFPNVSVFCMQKGLKYVSWVYDSPYINLYSYTVVNDCNYIFIFDYGVYEELCREGIQTVFYLPMAINPQRLNKMKRCDDVRRKPTYDISFVGSLYMERKHNIYEKFHKLDEFSKGYLDGIIEAQLQVSGYNFLQELLNDEIINALEKIYPTNPDALTVASPSYIYAEYVLNRRVTALERKRIIEYLSERHQVQLFTYDKEAQVGKAINRGPIDYYDEMPYVFMNSKINLNITLRSIKTGIPLRAMDIMGCGGFLLTNYQREFFEYFEADKEFVYYENMEDLNSKVEFYLQNDDLRCKIAENGCKKVQENHTFVIRVKDIINIVQ